MPKQHQGQTQTSDYEQQSEHYQIQIEQTPKLSYITKQQRDKLIRQGKRKATYSSQIIPSSNSEDDEQQNSSIRRSDNRSQKESSISSLHNYSFQTVFFPAKHFRQSKYAKLNKLIQAKLQEIPKFILKNKEHSHIAKISQIKNSFEGIQIAIQKGQQTWQIVSTFREANKALWGLGLKDVLSWIRCIALGISELEQLGIYHPSLSLQGTIRVLRGGRSVFKIADFSDALKVAKSLSTETGKDKAFELTRDIFDFWLRFRYDLKRPRKPCYHFADDDSDSNLSASSTQTFYDEAEIIKELFGINKQSIVQQFLSIKRYSQSNKISDCCALLERQSKNSHLRQFSQLVTSLLDEETCQKIQEVRQLLNKLQLRQINYQQFSQRLPQILQQNIQQKNSQLTSIID